MSTTPTYADELQFLGFRDSSRNGPCVTFALPDRKFVDNFVGMEKRRFAAVLVLIGDDELPEAPPMPSPPEPEPAKPKAPKADHSLSKWAALRCADPEFWRWIEGTEHDGRYPAADFVSIDSAQDAAEWVRQRCEVKSRAEFDAIPDAAERLRERVRAPWLKHCIARGLG